MRNLILIVAAAALLAAPVLACDAGKVAKAGEIPACCQGKARAALTTASTNPELAPETGASCPLAKLEAHAAAGCKASAAALEATTAYTGAGKVLCAKCDLEMSDECRSMFRASDQKKYTLCTAGVNEQLLKLTRHGELDITVHGQVLTAENGEDILCLEGFTVGTI